ncbi:MAG: hypothetical protein J7K40_05615 [candidate division Zixibacteria bacterium]|nr:hypothetical protein [candidate division Zixibacteria bacterium]
MKENSRTITFKDFKLTIRAADKPDAVLVLFHGGTDVDGYGCESSAGDRKKLEEDFKFMFIPAEAPSRKKGEYILYFRLPGKEEKFFNWVDKQKKMYYGIEDDR